MARYFVLLLFFLASISAGCASPIHAAEPIPVGKDFSSRHIGRQVEVLLDPSHELTFADIASPRYSGVFKLHGAKGFNYGMKADIIWLRFRISSPQRRHHADRLVLAVDKSNFPYADLFVPGLDGAIESYTRIRSSYLDRTSPHILRYRYPVFKLPQSIPAEGYF